MRSARFMPISIALLAAIAACVGEDPQTSSNPSPDGGGSDSATGGTDDATANDSGTDGAAAVEECVWDDPFDKPSLLAGDVNSDGTDMSAQLNADETQIFFVSDGTRFDAGSLDYQVFSATRKSRGEPFVGAKRVASLQGSARDTGVTVNADTTLVILSSNRESAGQDLYVTQRMIGGDFDAPTRLTQTNSPATDERPFLTSDGQSLLFSSSRGKTSSDDRDIYIAQKTGTGFGLATLLDAAVLATTDNELSPVLTSDGLTVYFAIEKLPRIAPFPPTEIYRAHRDAKDKAFGPPARVAELASGFLEIPSWISPDSCRIYFSSRRARSGDGGTNADDVYMAERKPRKR